jgi:RNA polymerase sigma-70 factor, ECF subfamily
MFTSRGPDRRGRHGRRAGGREPAGPPGEDRPHGAGEGGRTAENRSEPDARRSRGRDVARHKEAGDSGPAKPASDEDLVRALYVEHAAPLLRYALRMTDGDRQRAEDIVQETLLRAWMHPEAIADRPARPWLFAVARNLAVDAHRARKARPHEVGESALSLVAVPDEADRVLESWAVADALAALRPDHRRVLLETYYRGKSVAEAAAVLGVPAGTVKSRAFYALRALKLELEERGLAP